MVRIGFSVPQDNRAQYNTCTPNSYMSPPYIILTQWFFYQISDETSIDSTFDIFARHVRFINTFSTKHSFSSHFVQYMLSQHYIQNRWIILVTSINIEFTTKDKIQTVIASHINSHAKKTFI